MTLDDAKAECARWFAHLNGQRERSKELQKLAHERRNGTVGDKEASRRMTEINQPRVYDGAELERAVQTLLNHVR